MRHQLLTGAMLLAAIPLACQQSAAPTGPSLGAGSAFDLPPVVMTGDHGSMATTAAGLYRIALEPGSLQASASRLAGREAQATDDRYDLSIANFTRPDTLRVRNVARVGGALELTLELAHPFAAPNNLAGPATAANRADLGVAGRMLILADVPSATGNTYFSDDGPVIANTALVANADAYWRPGGILPALATTATVFPYLSFVDETGNGSRAGVSNGGIPTGNYTPGTGGWQADNIGPNRDNWTGYGVLHQGQRSQRTLALNLAALGSGPVNIDVALVVQYTDPRGGTNAQQKRANRLPSQPTNVFNFIYRMPHGALDGERITFLGETGSGLVVNSLTATTLNFHVVDWDARASATIESDLALDPFGSNIAPESAGVPSLAVSIPGIFGSTIAFAPSALQDDDSAFGGDAGQDSGEPGDALYYTETVTNTTLMGQTDGTYTGLVRVTDPEADNDTSGWRFLLQPDLSPVVSNPPSVVTYQAFPVVLNPPSAPPTATVTMLTPNVSSGGTATVQVSAYSDPEGDPIEVRIDWNNDGDFNDPGESGNMVSGLGGPPVNFVSPITYTFSGPAPDTRQVPAAYTDGISSPIPVVPTMTFTVLEPGLCGAPWTSPTTFTSGWPNTDFVNFATAPSGVSGVNFCYGAFRVPTLNVPVPGTHAGWIYQQRITTPDFSQHIYRAYANGANLADGFTVIPLTNAPATLGSDATTSRQIHSLEADSTNRILFSCRAVGTFSSITVGMATIYSGGESSFRWFDTDGGSAPVTDAGITTVATPNPVVGMALDQADNVYIIDSQHILRKYLKASGYTQDLTAPFPLDLKAPPYNIPVTIHVLDFDINFYNQAFFIVTETAAGLEQLYRVECDGQFDNPVPGGGANPLEFQVYTGSTAARQVELVIDNYTSTGALAGSQTDGQMFVLGFNGQDSHEIHYLTSRLQRTGGQEWAIGAYIGAIDVQRNWIVSRQGTAVVTHRVYGSPPAGWQ